MNIKNCVFAERYKSSKPISKNQGAVIPNFEYFKSGDSPMAKVQVIIRKDDRVWDSIKPSIFLALRRIAEFMKEDEDLDIFVVGHSIKNRQLKNQPDDEITGYLKERGFEVTIKERE